MLLDVESAIRLRLLHGFDAGSSYRKETVLTKFSSLLKMNGSPSYVLVIRYRAEVDIDHMLRQLCNYKTSH